MINSQVLEKCALHFSSILESLSEDSFVSHIVTDDSGGTRILLTLIVENPNVEKETQNE
jgi:hypothetical protein